jgi:DeoR family transcriptional regulator, fructose operon transcriptional repressor
VWVEEDGVELPLPLERHQRIEGLLDARGVVRVSALSELLGVSEVTVRRDLEALERRGVLERTRGGAISTRRMDRQPAYADAISISAPEKRWIGRSAARQIEAGDTVFLNEGTTTLEVFRNIQVAPVKVVTNHVAMAMEPQRDGVELILVGGRYRAVTSALVGPFASETLGRVYASRTFLGVEGVSVKYGLTTPSLEEADLARQMVERTRGPVVVVADHTKLGVVGEFVPLGLDHVDRLVTDAAIATEYHKSLTDAGVEVTLVGGGGVTPNGAGDG